MPADVKVLTNVGYKKGLNGPGIVYAGRSVLNGTYMFLVQHIVSSTVTWRYYQKSRIQSGLDGGEVILASNVNMSLFTDQVEPDFVTPSSETFLVVPNVTNEGTLPRLYDLQPAYTLKGDTVTSSEIEKIQLVGTNLNTTATGTTGTTDTTTKPFIPTDFNLLFSNPVQFIQDNFMFVAVVLGLIYFLRRKQKKPLWII